MYETCSASSVGEKVRPYSQCEKPLHKYLYPDIEGTDDDKLTMASKRITGFSDEKITCEKK